MEYKIGYYLFNKIEIEEGKLESFLNEVGKKNWELVYFNQNDGLTILKRQLPISIKFNIKDLIV